MYETSIDDEFKKPSRCGTGQCVEVAIGEHSVAVRDSKNIGRAPLHFTIDEWKAFISAVRSGEFSPRRRPD